MKRIRLKGSYVVEATVAFPIFLLMTVAFILSFRMLTLGAVMDTAVEESNLELSMMITRMYYNGTWDRYRNAPEGQQYERLDYWDTYELLSREELPIAINPVMRMPFSEKYRHAQNGRGALSYTLLSNESYADAAHYDYRFLRREYDSVSAYFPEDMKKGDYEKMFQQWLLIMLDENTESFIYSRMTRWIFNVGEITVSDWKMEEKDGVVRYEMDVNYRMHLPLYWLGGEEWMKSKHITGYAVVH